MLSKILVLLVAAQVAHASGREMLVSSNDPAGTKTVPFDVTLLPGMNDPPESDPWVVRKAVGLEPEQVSVVYYGEGRVLISWVVGYPAIGPKPVSMDGTGLAPTVKIGTVSKNYPTVVVAKPVTYKQDYTSISQPSYASGIINHAIVTVTPGVKHFYIVGDKTYDTWSAEYSFTAVPKVASALPFKIGVMSDIGQTYNTTQMLQNLKASNPQLILNIGDFTYADTYAPTGVNKFIKAYTGAKGAGISYQGRWDTWGRLFENIAGYIPQLHTNGNHEIEGQTINGVTYTQTSYSARYPVPRASGTSYTTANNDNLSEKTSINNMYYTINVPGATLIFLTPYVKKDTYGPTSAQYIWLESKLKLVNRKVTPWLIVSFHAPWYNTYVSHFKENECMRKAYEPLFKKYGVDVVLTGHVHAYERTKPVYNYKIDNVCGAVHITVGDGGNQEKLAKDFIDQTKAPPSWCNDPTGAPAITNPKCIYKEADGSYCYKAQPAWSAYREPSFGHGILTIQSATTAKWEWYRAHEKGVKVSDSVTMTRNPTKCGLTA